MSAKPETDTSNKFGMVWWLLVVAIILGGVYANTLYASVGVFYRSLAGLALTAVAVGLALQTESGRAAWDLAKESRVEVRKVVWPTRHVNCCGGCDSRRVDSLGSGFQLELGHSGRYWLDKWIDTTRRRLWQSAGMLYMPIQDSRSR
jgi:hypothetical protein